MANAEVGDDVYGEDPSVNQLQKKCAELTGKDTALFVPSGCMANQLAIKSQTNPGDEIILEADSHILNYETAAPAFISSVQVISVQGRLGIFTSVQIEPYIRPEAYYFPKTALVCIENTHNRAGGTIFQFDEIKKLRKLTEEKNIHLHIDGARIFNASVVTGIDIKEYASLCDTISFCFSKGLGAPVGSILCGDNETITRAHKYRKIIGGGMRQAGILASAALFALENNIDRLREDHKKARYFAEELIKTGKILIDPESVQTNIIIFRLNDSRFSNEKFKQTLKDKGVLIGDGSYGYLRAVFHLDVSLQETEEALYVFRAILHE